MNKTVSYSILKYTHSKFIGEELNVGILFVFPEEQHVEFVYPSSISRIKKAYPGASIDLIKSYLQSFKSKAPKLVKGLKSYSFDFNELVSEQFLVTDGSSLQFTKFSHALTIKDIEQTKKTYFDLYLNSYEILHNNEIKHKTDKIIVQECRKIILSKRPELENALLVAKEPLVNDKVIFKYDLRWQNGTSNLIKGVTFDYSEEELIVNKALLIQNQLNYLSKIIDKQKARIDLLIVKPQASNFIDSYIYAKQILENTEANKSVIEENEIEEYSDKVVDEIEL
jgi:hypothetical protein